MPCAFPDFYINLRINNFKADICIMNCKSQHRDALQVQIVRSFLIVFANPDIVMLSAADFAAGITLLQQKSKMQK